MSSVKMMLPMVRLAPRDMLTALAISTPVKLAVCTGAVGDGAAGPGRGIIPSSYRCRAICRFGFVCVRVRPRAASCRQRGGGNGGGRMWFHGFVASTG